MIANLTVGLGLAVLALAVVYGVALYRVYEFYNARVTATDKKAIDDALCCYRRYVTTLATIVVVHFFVILAFASFAVYFSRK